MKHTHFVKVVPLKVSLQFLQILGKLLNLLLDNAKITFFLKSRQDVPFVVLGHIFINCTISVEMGKRICTFITIDILICISDTEIAPGYRNHYM